MKAAGEPETSVEAPSRIAEGPIPRQTTSRRVAPCRFGGLVALPSGGDEPVGGRRNGPDSVQTDGGDLAELWEALLKGLSRLDSLLEDEQLTSEEG